MVFITDSFFDKATIDVVKYKQKRGGSMYIVKVLVEHAIYKLDTTYDYLSKYQVLAGCRVHIRFGYQQLIGYVVECQETLFTQKQLEEKNELLQKNMQKVEAEKNRLLNLVSNISQEKEIPVESEQGEEDVLNFGTDEEEEYIPTFGQKKSEQEIDVEDEVFEELTAPILQKYLAGSEVKYISSEIRHSEEGEQLHANINNLDYVFLFSQPAAFEISVPKKKSRALDRLLIRLNTQHPGVKFYFDENDSRVYASGYFSNTMIPENLMKKVHEVSDCFRQK